MLKKLAVALVAASVFAAPVLAKTVSQTPVAKPAVTATTKIAAARQVGEARQEEPPHRQAGPQLPPWQGCACQR